MQIGHFFPGTRKFFLRDLVISTVIFLSAIICCFVINHTSADSADSGHVPLIFVLAVALISRMTDGYFFGALGSLISVFFVNYFFTYPYRAFNFTISGYPLTFFSMLTVSLIISAAIRHTRTTSINAGIAQTGKFTTGDLTVDFETLKKVPKTSCLTGAGHPSWVSRTHPSFPLNRIKGFIDSLRHACQAAGVSYFFV